jgi:hypothetical protein
MGCFVPVPLAALILAGSATAQAGPGLEEPPAAGKTLEAKEGTTPTPPKAGPGFLRRLAGDFGRTFGSRDGLSVLGIGGGATVLARSVDHRIPRSRFNSELHHDSSLDRLFEAGDFAGDAPVLAGSAVAILAAGALAGDARLEGLGGDLVRAQIVSGTITFALKLASGRERPDGSGRLSFPSGHAAGAFASATVFSRRYGFKAGAPAYVVAAWIAASRLNENKHFLSDVTFGAAVGIAAGRAATAGRESKRVIVVPQLIPGGGIGVQVTLIGHP